MSKKEHQIDVELLKINDQLIAENEIVYVKDIKYREDLINIDVYHCRVDPYHTFIVEGIVAHNAVDKTD